MRKLLVASVLSIGLFAVGAAGASAAATRAEYIAQVDPICQGTNDAVARAAKGLQADKKAGRFKLAARKIRAETAIFAPGVEQIAAIEPVPSDAQLIGTWLQGLRSETPLAKRLAKDYAHGHLHTRTYVRFGAVIADTEALVAGFGFQYCQHM